MKNVIHWFRQDLRLSDNPSLFNASSAGSVVPVYIFDDVITSKIGAASKVWLFHSLTALNDELGGKLLVYRGNPERILLDLIKKYSITQVNWNRCYEPLNIKRDTQIKQILTKQKIQVNTFNGSLLWEPWSVLKADGSPYRVFTPFFYKGCLNAQPPRFPLGLPPNLNLLTTKSGKDKIIDLGLLPEKDWHKNMLYLSQVGEKNAQLQLSVFLKNHISKYKEGRDYPAQGNTSKLSPNLHFGEISCNQIWYATRSLELDENSECFCSELGWREFAHNLLYYNPDISTKNLQTKFNNFPWAEDNQALKRWQQGQTGIPIVDAGMRELWQTGYMHNRVRMIVASFLVKNLLIDWRFGEQWFWECLFDADMGNNSTGWQWVAGCGADAAPYFRIFNPVTQGQKFDCSGIYTRKFVPELAHLPDKYLFNPWEAPENVLNESGVILGQSYPEPIVDLKKSRQIALDAFSSIK